MCSGPCPKEATVVVGHICYFYCIGDSALRECYPPLYNIPYSFKPMINFLDGLMISA